MTKSRLLRTTGKGFFEEVEWDCPEPGPTEIQVKALMTGVCRSDIDMMVGKFGPLPDSMSGHEGLGEVVKLGDKIEDIKVGDYVATRGEPAYADIYNCRYNEYVKVPEVNPKYILEPVACGINVVYQPMHQLSRWPSNSRILIIGSGFLGWVAFHTLLAMDAMPNSPSTIHVVGKHNSANWLSKGIVLQDSIPKNEKYDAIIDLSSSDEVFKQECLAPGGILILAAEKHPTVNTTFGFLLWNSNSIICPSPRSEFFPFSMILAARWIENGNLSVDHYWTRGYNRNTEWQQAFADGLFRPANYSRGYIKW
jgi:D-arabinose 1-dehydrogenase-like Zn-dependent alcohol dehydrogenase